MHDRHRRGRKPTVGSQHSPISGTGTASRNKTFHSYHQNQQASASAKTMDTSTTCTDTTASACTGTRGTYTAPQIPFTLPRFTRTSASTSASTSAIVSASVSSRLRKRRGRNTNTSTRSTRHELCFQWIVRECIPPKSIPIISCIFICVGIFCCLLHLVSVSFAKTHIGKDAQPYSNVKSLPIPMPSVPFATKTTVASTISHASMHVTKGGILKIPTAAKSKILDEDNKADTSPHALIRKPNQIQKPKYTETLPKKKSNINTSKTDKNSEQSSIPNRVPKPSQITPESEFEDIPISIVHKQNAGNPFSLTIHFENDIVSSRIDTHTRSQSQGWEHSKLQQLTEIYTSYSQQHNIPLEDLTFVDIGAHVGWFAFNMAALGVQVLAFEPCLKMLL